MRSAPPPDARHWRKGMAVVRPPTHALALDRGEKRAVSRIISPLP